MKKNSIIKISLVMILLVLSVISISFGNEGKSIITNWFSPKNDPVYDVPLYITGVGLNRESFICIYEDDVTLNGSTVDPDSDCMVKITSDDMIEEGVLESAFLSSDDTYILTIFTQDDCNNAYIDEYTTSFTPGDYDPIFLSLEDYNYNFGGDNNHYCNNGAYYNEATLYIYKSWQNEGNNYGSQRPDKTSYFVGTYDADTNTYNIDRSISSSILSSSSSYSYFGRINTKYNYLFETNNNIDNYQCILNGVDGEFVTIDDVKYCVVKLNGFGNNYTYYASVYNRYTGPAVPTVTYDVKVNWDDDDNRDGIRPNNSSSSVGTYVYGNNNIYYTSATAKKMNDWKTTIQLPIKDYKDNDINYIFSLFNVPNGYTCTLEKDDENSEININCVHEPAKIDVHVTNEWRNLIDESPDKVVVNLLKNGEIFKTVELTEEGNWEYTFEDLYKYEDGVAITYGIQQKAIEGYELQVLGAYVEGFQLINSQVNETRKVNITTEMVCGNGTVTGAEQLVYGSDSSAESIVVTADEGYVIDYIKVNGEKIDIDENLTTYILEHFEDLTEDKNIEACFKKIKKPKAQNIINPNTKRGFFTGTFILSLGALSYLIVTGIKKKSIKNKKFDLGIATTTMVISLFSILTIHGGIESNTVHKKSVAAPDNVNYIYLANYSISNTELVINGSNGYHDTITLTGVESENIASIGYVYKIPVEPNDTYTISLNDLYCSGTYSDPTDITFTVTVGDSDPAVYYAGPEVNYYGLEVGPNCNFFTDKTFVVKKLWVDEYKDGAYKPDRITISGYVKYYDYENDEIEMTPYSCDVAESNDWTCETTVRVPRNWTFQDQQEFIYGSITESFDPSNSNIDDDLYYYVCGQTDDEDDKLSGGICSTNIYSSNIITPETGVYGIEVTNTLKKEDEPDIYTLVKVWNDNDDAEGLRPDSISGSVTAASETDNFTFSLSSSGDWTDTVTVSKTASLSSCEEDSIDYYVMDSCVIDSVNKTITVTNTIMDKYTVKKVWVDDNNADRQRPASITVTLNGDVTESSVEVSASDNWEEVVYIDKSENNLVCDEYSVYNYVKNGCVVDKENKTITVTNTIKDRYTVRKIWEDDNDVNGQRPSEYISIYIEGTGTDGRYTRDTARIYESDNWEGAIYITPGATYLQCFEDTPLNYVVDCVIDTDNKTITITNILYKIYTVKKIWNDNNNAKGLRPSYIYVYYQPYYGSGTTTVYDNGWEAKAYVNPSIDAESVTMTCDEYIPNSYYYMESCVVDKENKTITVTNSLKEEYTIKKVWNDNDNEHNLRPTNYVYTSYYLNSSYYNYKYLYKSSNWESKLYFEPGVIQDGSELTCTENAPSYYRFDGCVVDVENKTITLTNTVYDYYTVEKVWEDDDNRDNIRPTSSGTVNLRSSNSKLSRNVTLTKSNNWTTGIYVHPDTFKDGSTLTCTESSVNGYSFEGCELDTENKTIKVINSRVPLKTPVKVTKNWEGVDEEDIPEKLEVNLYADGVKVESYDLTADEEWTHTFEVNKNNNGVPIVYTVTETMIDGYYVNITGNASTGFVLSNVKTDETKKVKITTSVICGEGTVTGDEELIYGSNSTPNLIVATGAKGYAVEYVMFNDEKRVLEDITNKYSFSGFYDVIEDKEIKVCFVEKPELLEEELDGGDEPVSPEPEEPGDNSSESNKDTPINPNTIDMIFIAIIGAILSVVVFVKLRKKIYHI